MKKFLQVALAAVLSFGFISNVNALTEEELLDFAKGTYTVAGTKIKVDDEFIVELEKYLNENEMTSEQAQTLKDAAEKILDTLDKNGSINPNKLDRAKRKESIKTARDAAAVLGIGVNYDAEEQALLPYKDGQDLAPIYLVTLKDGSVVITPVKDKKPAKTGNDYTTYIAFSGAILALVAGTTIYRKKKENE